MAVFTLDQLRQKMHETAGESEDADFDGDITDTPFEELDFDSLAIMEIAARIKQENGIVIPDDEIGNLKTPGAMVDYINMLAV
jgi:act minimal PKS acyl carrier protein